MMPCTIPDRPKGTRPLMHPNVPNSWRQMSVTETGAYTQSMTLSIGLMEADEKTDLKVSGAQRKANDKASPPLSADDMDVGQLCTMKISAAVKAVDELYWSCLKGISKRHFYSVSLHISLYSLGRLVSKCRWLSVVLFQCVVFRFCGNLYFSG